MKQAPIPRNEKERLISLHTLGLLDTKPEERFDRITRTATKIFNVPISTLTLVDGKREWFKSVCGLDQKEGDRAISFCGHALLANEIFVIPDTKKDVRFSDNPMVIDKPYIRFYAGMPIINADGQRVGVFCIKDTKPRAFSKNDEEILVGLTTWAELEINSRNLSLALAERKKVEQNLIEEKAIEKLKYDLNAELIKNKFSEESFKRILEIAAVGFKWDFATIWIPDASGKLHSRYIWKRDPKLYQNFEKATREWVFFDGVGLPGRIYKSKKSVWILDAVIDKNFPRASFAKMDNLHTGFGFPIYNGDTIYAVLDFFIEKQTDVSKDFYLRLFDDIGSEIGQFIYKEELRKTIEREKAKNEAILASIGDAVMACDKDGRVMVFNTAAEALSGFSTKEAIGHHYSQSFKFIRESDGKSGNDFIAETIKAGQGKKMENHILLITKDGRKIPVADSAAPIKNAQGEIMGCVLVFRDMTKDREIDKAKSEFVSLASHQLRTPLGITKWYLEVLQKEDYLRKAPQQTKEYFDEVFKNNERVLSLVRDLLSVSRIEQGRVKDVPKSVDIRHSLMEIVAQMQILAHKKKVSLHLTVQGRKIPSINIDVLRFHEIVENLITNAIEYTLPTGSVDVALNKAAENLVITVKDSGIGISLADQEKIFTKFFRSEKATSQNPEGSGLGLYVVKSYVEGWGGKISVESAEGKGTAFEIMLPISQKKNIERGDKDEKNISS